MADLTPFQRIWRFLDFTSERGCWIWTGGVNSWGYGAFHVGSIVKAWIKEFNKQFVEPSSEPQGD